MDPTEGIRLTLSQDFLCLTVISLNSDDSFVSIGVGNGRWNWLVRPANWAGGPVFLM